MGKVNNALRMLAILRSRDKVTRKEIAKELEVNIREITRYKEALESTGVTITEIRGRGGGYVLENKDYLLNLELSKSEENALMSAKSFLDGQGLHYYRDLCAAIDKINAVNPKKNSNIKPISYSKGIKIKAYHEEESNKWLVINDGIMTNRKVKITYKDSKGNTSIRVIDPYGQYTYYGANFFVGKCNDKKELRNFKLIRIKEISLLNDKFEKEKFNIKEYLKNSIGIYKGQQLLLKLKITYPYAQGFSEFQWVDNEKVTEYIEEGYIIYEATVEGKTELIPWIMGMGTACTVLEPKELIEEIKEEYKKVLNNYIE